MPQVDPVFSTPVLTQPNDVFEQSLYTMNLIAEELCGVRQELQAIRTSIERIEGRKIRDRTGFGAFLRALMEDA